MPSTASLCFEGDGLTRAQDGAGPDGQGLRAAANAFEALVRNGDPDAPDRGFRRTIAAAAYHLAGFSSLPIRFSTRRRKTLPTSPGETAIRHPILRDLDQLRGFVREWLDDEAHGDEQIAEALRAKDPDVDEALSTILNTTICRARGVF